ncbi:MAG TPA: GAF domain-containing protein, partial [Geobacteraceae bacterium]
MLRKKLAIELTPLNIAIFYACVGGIWLLLFLSRVMTGFFRDPASARALEVNTSVFILVTAWLLYFLIRKSQFDMKQRKEALTRLNRSLRAYSECHQALIRAHDEVQLMQEVCRTIVEAGGYRVAWVGLAENDEGMSIRPVVQWGDEKGYVKNLRVSWANIDRGRGPTGVAIRSGQPVVAQYIEFDPKWELWRAEALEHGFLSSISVPLVDEGRAFAALVIYAGETDAFDVDEVKLLSELADDLSYGITTLRTAIQRKSAEKECMLLASVIEQAKEGIFLFDGEGVIKYVNPAVEAITGRPPQAMINHNINTLEYQEYNRIFYEAIMKAISRGEENAGRFFYKRKDGVMLEIDVNIWSVSDVSGNVISYAALARDITHEMQLERQLRQAQRMEAIGTLAGGISHDFNNTLASVITCAEMALDEVPPGSPLQELLDVILKSGLRGKNLARQILTFSRQVEQERQEVQVEMIVNESLKLLRASLPASIEIRLNRGHDLRRVVADPTQIHQIVMNLCTNAVHAMRGQPHGVLEIWLDNVDVGLVPPIAVGFGTLAPGVYLRLTVKDSGHGMDEKTKERIFDPFFTTKSQAEGTGLGLSVIHGIVTNH